jgi:hypothetical protein
MGGEAFCDAHPESRIAAQRAGTNDFPRINDSTNTSRQNGFQNAWSRKELGRLFRPINVMLLALAACSKKDAAIETSTLHM